MVTWPDDPVWSSKVRPTIYFQKSENQTDPLPSKAHSIKVNLLQGKLPEWLVDLTLSGSLSATQGTLKVDGGVMLTKSGDTVSLDSAGTYLGFVDSTITGTGTVGIKLKVAKGYIVEVGASASLTPTINVSLIARFAGTLGGDIRISTVNFQVFAQLKYAATAYAKSKLTGQSASWSSAENGTADDVFEPVKLIDYHG